MRKTLLPILLLLLLVAVSATKPPPPKRVVLANGKFTPPALTIKAGETVQWINGDNQDHSIEANDGAFASGKIKAGQTFDQKFTKPGTYLYHCTLHPREKGTITVKQAP